MKEKLISFETAQLAKEKGFTNIELNFLTQSLLQKWLREVHKIHIIITPYASLCMYYVEWVKTEGMKYSQSGFSTYEEALEYALQKSLKFVNNKIENK